MSHHVFINRIVKTRKIHHCWGCAREFPAGTRLNLVETVECGDFYRTYWCSVCKKVWNDEDYDSDFGVSYGDIPGNNPEYWEEVRATIE